MQYPIISISKSDPNIYAFDKEASNRICLIDYLHVHDNETILDSTGKIYSIKNAYKVKWAYVWGYHPFYKGRSAIIDFNIEKTESLDLPTFKGIIKRQLEKGVKPGFWYTKKDIPTMVQKVEEADSYKQVIEIFLYD